MSKFVKCKEQFRIQSYIFDNHNKERKFYGESFLGISWALNECGTDISAHNLEHR